MDAGIPDWLVATHKKRNSPQSPFLTACGDPQICFCSRQLCTYRRNKKSAKRLPCLYMVSSDTTYNPKQRMPRPSSIQAAPEPAACGKCGCSGYFHTGYTIVFPPFTDRHRIKINYGIILAQHLVSCQLNNTIYSVFSLSIFVRNNPFAKFILLFYIFSSICPPVRYFFFRLSCYSSSFVSGIRSLTTEERTPSCIWVPVNGSLL